MKTSTSLFVFTLFFLVALGCSRKDTKGSEELHIVNLVNSEFFRSQAQIEQTLLQVFKCIENKEADKLNSFHLYGPKFTEFKNSELRTGSAENEAFERGLLDSISGFNYNLHDLKIDVFDNVGKVTFHAEFIPQIGEAIQNPTYSQATMLFIRVEGKWKIVHEHFSPLSKEAIASLDTRKAFNTFITDKRRRALVVQEHQ